MNPSTSAPAEAANFKLFIRDLDGNRQEVLTQTISHIGNGPDHEVSVASRHGGRFLTLAQTPDGLRIYPLARSLKINGLKLKGEGILRHMDLLEWDDGHAVVLSAQDMSDQNQRQLRSLVCLQKIAEILEAKNSLQAGLAILLKTVLDLSEGEEAVLVAENGAGSAWEVMAAQSRLDTPPAPSRTIFSQTVVQAALKKGEPLMIANVIGHPFSSAHSMIQSRYYSVGCLPLIVEGRPFAALFLATRTPGRSLNPAALTEMQLLATQAVFMLSAKRDLAQMRKQEAERKLTRTESALLWDESLEDQDLQHRIERFAAADLPILIMGETGTGKELIARELHCRSPRHGRSFVAINCAAIPESLLESALFGHVRGAFTGAVQNQPGRFQIAEGGTLFLDEVGELPLELQAKLLRVLQEKEIEAVGATRPTPIDVRVLAATNRDLGKLVREGRFRADLYYRLAGATLETRPLRLRRAQIVPLAQHLLQRYEPDLSLSVTAQAKLTQHPWPGNVRELEYVLQRASLLARGSEIGPDDLEFLAQAAAEGWSEEDLHAPTSLKDAQRDFNQDHVQKILRRCDGNRSEAARLLGLSERTLYRLLAEGTDTAGRRD